MSLKPNIRFLRKTIGEEKFHVAPIRVFESRTTIPSNPSSKPIPGLVEVPTLRQHCNELGATHMPGGAAVDVAAAATSVEDSAMDVISVVGTAVVVTSVDWSVVRMTAKVEDSDALALVTSTSVVVSELLIRPVSVDSNPERVGVDSNDDMELDGRQGPAEAPPKKINSIKAVNRILTDKVSVLKERIQL